MGEKSHRELKRFQRGLNRLDPESFLLKALFNEMNFTTGQKGEMQHMCEGGALQKDEGAAKSFPHIEEWRAKAAEMWKHYQGPNFDKFINLATALLDEINGTLMRSRTRAQNANDIKEYCAESPMLLVYRSRLLYRMKSGLYHGAIQDATECLAMKRLGIVGNDSEPCEDDIMMLMIRGKIFLALKNLNDAYLDFRAACAAHRITKNSRKGFFRLLNLTASCSLSWH